MKIKLCSLVALVIALPFASAAPPAPSPDSNALKWDAESKQCAPKPGEVDLAFTFVCTNVSDSAVSITALHTTCGCTVAKLPTTPYKLEPGSNVTINVSMNVAGKYGLVKKSVNVESTDGLKSLLVIADIPNQPKLSDTK